MDFETLMSTAARQCNQKSSLGYSTKLPPQKKLPKAKVNPNVIASLLKEKHKAEEKKVSSNQKRLQENMVKEKKRKSGFSLKDLEDTSDKCDEKSKLKYSRDDKCDEKSKLKYSSDKPEKKLQTETLPKEVNNLDIKKAEAKISDSKRAEINNSDSKRTEEKMADHTLPKKAKVKKKLAPPPSIHYSAILGMADKNVGEKVSPGAPNVQDLIKVKQGKKRNRPLTQRELEELERKNRRIQEEKMGVKPRYATKRKEDTDAANKSPSAIKKSPKALTTEHLRADEEKKRLLHKDPEPKKDVEREKKEFKKPVPVSDGKKKAEHGSSSSNVAEVHKTPRKEKIGKSANRPIGLSELEKLEKKRPTQEKTHPQHSKAKWKNFYPDEDSDEYDEDMDDFIDDDYENDNGIGNDLSAEIWSIFGRPKKSRKIYDDDDDDCMEASYSDIMREEATSSKIGKKEDAEEERREEEKRREKLNKKRSKH